MPLNLEEVLCSSLITITPTPPVAETEVAGLGSQVATHPDKYWLVMDHNGKGERGEGRRSKQDILNA